MNVFDIQAKINLNTKDYIESLGQASKETSDFGSKVKGAFSASMKVGAAAIGAVVTETVALSGALVKGVNDLAEYGDHIDKQSQKMNMSAQAYQEWSAIMQHSGTSIDSMQMAMKTLANAAETDSEAFVALGMNLEDVKNMNSEELFSKTITALQNVESDTQRTYLAGQLLGRGATELGALLNTSAEDTEKMRQRVHELGGVMSDDAVKASAKFKDSMQDMKTAMSGMVRGITSEFLPSFTDVMDGLTSIFAGEEGGAEKVSKGIDEIVKNIGNATGKLKPVLSKIGGIMASVIRENAPKLIKEGTKLFGDIVVSTIKSLPEILSTAGDIFSGIGDVIIGYLPDWLGNDIKKIFESMSDMVGNIDFSRLTESFSNLGDSLEPLAEKLSGGIAWAFENVVKPFGEWLMNEALPPAIDGLSSAFDILGSALDFLEVPAKAVWEEFLQPLASYAGDFAYGTLDLLSKALGAIADEVKDVDWSGFWTNLDEFADNWKTGAKGIGDFLDENFDTIKEFFSESEFGASWFEFWTKTGELIETSVEGWVGFFSTTIQWINDFKDNWVTGFNEIKDAVNAVADALSSLFSGDLGSNWYDLVHGFFDKSYVPAYGDGGRVTKPTFAIVGEKEPETIIPDSKMKYLGGNNVTVNLTVEGGLSSDYDTDRLVERLSEKLAQLNIMQTRAIGGTGYGG